MGKDVYKKISSLKNKLNKTIQRTGLNSKETREISDKIDSLINEYYNSIKEIEYSEFSNMYYYYKKSYEALKNVTQQLERFPTVQEWNKFAKENNHLSSISLEYIAKTNWKYLEIRIERELNIEK